MSNKSVMIFDEVELDGSPTRSSTPSREKADKFKDAVTNAQFLSKIGITSIRRADQMTIAMQAGRRRIIVHMNGGFHITSRPATLTEVLVVERIAKAMMEAAGAVLGVKRLDLDFQLHHFFEEKESITRIEKVLGRLQSRLVFQKIRDFDPHYLLFGIGPSLEIGLGNGGHLDIYYEPRSISVGDMKAKYLLRHIEHGLALALKELR